LQLLLAADPVVWRRVILGGSLAHAG
jgi:hypothetical protein